MNVCFSDLIIASVTIYLYVACQASGEAGDGWGGRARNSKRKNITKR